MRIQIVIDDVYRTKLERLKTLTGRNQWQDLFSDAITVYNWAVEQRIKGRTVASMNETDENYRELQMPALDYAAEYALKHPDEVERTARAGARAEMA